MSACIHKRAEMSRDFSYYSAFSIKLALQHTVRQTEPMRGFELSQGRRTAEKVFSNLAFSSQIMSLLTKWSSTIRLQIHLSRNKEVSGAQKAMNSMNSRTDYLPNPIRGAPS